MASLILAVVAGGLLAFNHYEAMNDGKVYMALVLLMPLFFFLVRI
jgi:hypothetical protein